MRLLREGRNRAIKFQSVHVQTRPSSTLKVAVIDDKISCVCVCLCVMSIVVDSKVDLSVIKHGV